jgi:catechol 2,3-dioxygenase-like lactoylglutathione lyase family enzyme
MATSNTAVQERSILRGSPLMSSFAVKDLDAARTFYRDTLGLDVRDDTDMGIFEIHGANETSVMVYPKPDHQPAIFTVLNFPVKDIESKVNELMAAGVTMEHYDLPDGPKTGPKGIARDDNGPAIAWFTDPSGNILSVLENKR